ncbi:hypothetical protein [Microvirga roseola]|uniref:hypothetical protein n=1 Tax=Microvirga roseola TaxID=2883126 RepID=UPI001E5DFF50|nr:hypothetical protein [Microvirga roseola]
MVPTDALRQVEIGSPHILEELGQFGRHSIAVEEKLLEHGHVEADDLLEIGLEVVRDDFPVRSLQVLGLVGKAFSHAPAASNSEWVSQ